MLENYGIVNIEDVWDPSSNRWKPPLQMYEDCVKVKDPGSIEEKQHLLNSLGILVYGLSWSINSASSSNAQSYVQGNIDRMKKLKGIRGLDYQAARALTQVGMEPEEIVSDLDDGSCGLRANIVLLYTKVLENTYIGAEDASQIYIRLLAMKELYGDTQEILPGPHTIDQGGH